MGTSRRVSSAGLGALRVFFGVAVTVSSLRFIAKGWVETIYLSPEFHFTWALFDFVRPWPAPWMYAHIALLALLGVAISLGFHARAACLIFAVLFTWAELIEKAAYLNHYYLVSLLALWLSLLPSDRSFRLISGVGRRLKRDDRAASEDVHEERRQTFGASNGVRQRFLSWLGNPDSDVQAYTYGFLRAQVSIVYLFAGLAKLNADWLFRAEPLRTWLLRFGDTAVLGDLISSEGFAFAMSWSGAAFDLTIWAFMLWPRTRKWAFLVALLFHLTVGLLFPIGVFPFVMMLALTVFFAPDWPLQLARRLGVMESAAPASKQTGDSHTPSEKPVRDELTLVFAGLLLVTQLVVPLRHTLYPGHVNWTEEGYRFSWRVMLIEKTGLIEYRVRSPRANREVTVFPRDHLSKLQFQMLAVNPDMIQDYAHHLRATYQARWNTDDVEVYADSFVSFNGRPAQRWINPDIDLAAEPRGLKHREWILPQSRE